MNAQLPVVSVIVPVYNAGAFLRRTLDCVCGQTLRDIEIILVDDGSTDDSQSIQREYAARDSRIILLQQEHEYAGAARNKGMAIARGRYFSCLDADDIFEPAMLEKMVARAEAEQADIVVCRCDVFHTEGDFKPLTWQIHDRYLSGLNRKHFSLRDEYPQAAFQTFIGWAWDKLFRAEYVKSHGFAFGDTRHGNDAPFVFPAVAAAGCISIIDESLVKYRKSAGQISDAANVSRNVTACCTCINNIYRELQRLGASAGVWRSYYIWVVHYINWNMNKLPEPAREELREYILAHLEPQHHILSRLAEMPADELAAAYERDILLYRTMHQAPAEWRRTFQLQKRQSFPLNLFYKSNLTKTSILFFGIPVWTITRKHGQTIHRLAGVRIYTRKHSIS